MPRATPPPTKSKHSPLSSGTDTRDETPPSGAAGFRRRAFDHGLRISKFGLVGLSGLAVNSIALYVASGLLGIHYLAGVVIATQASTVWNFVLSDRWVFSRDDAQKRASYRFWIFWAMNNAAILVRGPMIFALTSSMGVNYLVSNIISLVVVMVLRYALSYSLIWRTSEPQPQSASS